MHKLIQDGDASTSVFVIVNFFFLIVHSIGNKFSFPAKECFNGNCGGNVRIAPPPGEKD